MSQNVQLHRGRPRSEEVHQAILKVALDQVSKIGFRALSIESIAEAARVGKTTIYRRWPNKAAVVMDAFLVHVSPRAVFPTMPRAIDSIRSQLHAQAKLFRSKTGKLISSLLGEAQFDSELKKAFRERWILPRRQLARETIEKAIEQGDLRKDISIETMIDMLYGPFYYRLQLETDPMPDAYADDIFNSIMNGNAQLK